MLARKVAMQGVALAAAAHVLSGCNSAEPLREGAQFGTNVPLPSPQKSLLPRVHIAPAAAWPPGAAPTAAPGFTVAAFADELDHPRWLYVLPNGDVLVAETNAPQRPDDSKGIRGWVMGKVMQRAGAVTPSANRVTLLRDADGDGKAEVRSVLLKDLNSPFGMAVVGSNLYIANTDALMRFPYAQGQLEITEAGAKVADLPAGRRNHHWTKNVIANADGSRLYVTVGSNSNVAENGMEQETQRAAILEIDPASGATRVFASGLRNPNGLAWLPDAAGGQRLWTVVNERDELGDDLVPDYLTSVLDGAFYGWPYSYFGAHVDERVKPQRPDLVASALVPDYALGSHTASLGLAVYDADALPTRYRGGVFIGQHGSWNRKPRSGYEVIFVPFADGKPAGKPETILSDFVNESGKALGRPVGVAVDKRGALLVADDVGNVVWRVSASVAATASTE
jgi:glucose/arabinose dehydrogenase